MASVPGGYESQVTAKALPGVKVDTTAPLEAFGGGASRTALTTAIQGTVTEVQKVVAAEKQRADEASVDQAWQRSTEEKNRLMYDEKEGAFKRRGQDAFGVVDDYGPKYKKFNDDIEESLSGEDQRQMFRRMRARNEAEFNGSLQRHLFTEARKFEDEQTKSTLATLRDDAVRNYQEPGKVEEAIRLQRAKIESFGANNGLSRESVQQSIAEAESKTHASVIDRMLANGDDLTAQAYYKRVKGQVTGADAANLEKVLEEGSLRGESQRRSLEIFSGHQSLSDALAQVDKIADPKVQDETRRRVKERFAEREQADKLSQEQNFEQAYNIAEKSRNRDDIPPAVWAAMSPAQRNSINSYLKNDSIETDRQLYEEIKLGLAHPATRAKYLQMDLNLYRHKISASDFQEIVKDKAALLRGDQNTVQKLDGFLSDTELINGILKDAGIDKKSDTAAQFRDRVDKAVMRVQRETSKKVTNDELRGIANSLLIEGVTSEGWIWNTRKRAFELEPDEKFTHIEVPESEGTAIKAKLERRGIPATESNILKVYLEGVRRGR